MIRDAILYTTLGVIVAVGFYFLLRLLFSGG
jgi:hypothetical protein